MKRQGPEWWENPIFYPAWWLLDRACDGLFYVWDRLDDPERKWHR